MTYPEQFPEYEADGCKAYFAGEPRSSNPYTKDSTEFKQWDMGWANAAPQLNIICFH